MPNHFKWMLASAVLTAAIALGGCEGGGDAAKSEATPPVNDPPPVAEVKSPPQPVVPSPVEATIVAVGDIMMHTPQLPGAYDEQNRSYDFSGFFRPIQSIVGEADWAVANLETPIAGDALGFHGYPRFNAPVALADAIAGAGFNIVTTANNHALDQGARGLIRTLETLRSKGLLPVGTADTEEAAQDIAIVEKNGISNAFLAYTYGTNGIPIPKDKPYVIHLIGESRMVRDIAEARRRGADLVTVSLHFGNEYERKPNDEQRRLARLCVEAGADLVIGHHPHVVQPYERVQVAGADGTTREALILYSLGNFISNQFGGYKEFGVIFKARYRKTFEADGTSTTSLVDAEPIPTWVHKYKSGGKSKYRILSLNAVADAHDDPLLSPRMLGMLSEKAVEMNAHLNSLTKEAGTAPAPQ